jgi:hypothetical protein
MQIANRHRFLAEVGLAAACGVLALLTAMWPEWIEALFGVDPDKGSGELEWMIVIGLACVAVISGVAARIEWRKLREA